jgi:hypothetical protein
VQWRRSDGRDGRRLQAQMREMHEKSVVQHTVKWRDASSIPGADMRDDRGCSAAGRAKQFDEQL